MTETPQQDTTSHISITMPKDVDKWIEFENLVFRISKQNLKQSLQWVNKNLRLDQDQMLDIIIDAFKFIPHRYNELKELFKLIGVSQKIFDHQNLFIASLFRDRIIKEDNIKAPSIFSIPLHIKELTDVFKIIENDDLDKLCKVTSTKNISNEQTVFEIDNSSVTMNAFAYAGLCGAVHCFKYMLINGHQITKNVVSACVMGGNIEIIEILQQRSITFNNTLSDAIISHNNEIARWISENYENQPILPVFYVRTHNTDYFLSMFESYIKSSTNMTQAFMFSLHSGNLPALQCIVENIPKANYTISPTLLIVATRQWNTRIIKYLIQHNIGDIECRDAQGFTPLNIAAQIGDVATIKYLLDKGADINTQSTDGSTPLISAAKAENIRAMNTLKSYGADINIRDHNNKIATDYSTGLNVMNIYS